MFTRDLEMCLMAAQSEAKDRRHEYLCVEHILYALLHNDNGVRIIRSCGGNVDRIKEDLEEFFDQQETMRDCLLYTSPSPRDRTRSRMPSSA